ncbi:MAG: hypothetical protein QXX48_07790 [Candidatus Korarchaeum sp.]
MKVVMVKKSSYVFKLRIPKRELKVFTLKGIPCLSSIKNPEEAVESSTCIALIPAGKLKNPEEGVERDMKREQILPLV